jgi:hypothetical protein
MAVTLSPIRRSRARGSERHSFPMHEQLRSTNWKVARCKGDAGCCSVLNSGSKQNLPRVGAITYFGSAFSLAPQCFMHPTIARGMGEMGSSKRDLSGPEIVPSHIPCHFDREPIVFTSKASCRAAESSRPLVWILETVSKPFFFLLRSKITKRGHSRKSHGQGTCTSLKKISGGASLIDYIGDSTGAFGDRCDAARPTSLAVPRTSLSSLLTTKSQDLNIIHNRNGYLFRV